MALQYARICECLGGNCNAYIYIYGDCVHFSPLKKINKKVSTPELKVPFEMEKWIEDRQLYLTKEC
jgi:hypothetical protein